DDDDDAGDDDDEEGLCSQLCSFAPAANMDDGSCVYDELVALGSYDFQDDWEDDEDAMDDEDFQEWDTDDWPPCQVLYYNFVSQFDSSIDNVPPVTQEQCMACAANANVLELHCLSARQECFGL
ncbi:MAG TPA: hypothetical protein DIU15_18505, partial [Deltaproteobacteria bacterium]|nr:hypothetical protein [Deltaproteobacteria bacterium]